MKKLLVIGYVWPEPNSSAAGQYMLTLLKSFLSQNYQITFACAASESVHRYPFEQLGIQKAQIKLNCPSFDDFVVDLAPDVVLFDRFMIEEQFGWRVAKHCPNAMRILDLEDLWSLRHIRMLAYKQQRPLQAQDYLQDIVLRELAAIWRCDLSLVISHYEMDLLINQFNLPPHILAYLPFVLDSAQLTQFKQQSKHFAQRANFVFIGNFKHEPNWDAVLYLKQHIWPLISKQIKDAELHIYGAYPAKKVTDLHNPKQRFLVKGWADDAHQVVGNARVCMAPLRFGAGLKGKLFEAMQLGTPSVTTNVGIEGYFESEIVNAGKPNIYWPGAIADGAEEIANKAVELYNNQVLWQAAQDKAWVLLEHFRASKFLPEFCIRVEAIQQDLVAHRAQNIIGAMLQHHTMKSTQYMAQWIAAKNA
ncbi:glycosyltransferase [Catenovulum agarivorans]|uniref:glycosyltransferase n=1 Tax=Catenovulum agarivorans TaxID=1172192 RepID=UPI00054F8B05|nr:glycosyltransferase [Catenovulum agarivorans]